MPPRPRRPSCREVSDEPARACRHRAGADRPGRLPRAPAHPGPGRRGQRPAGRAPAPARPSAGRRRWARRWLGGLGGWRRLAVAGLAGLLLAAAVLVASPPTREAVARRLGLRGIGVELGGP